MERAWDGLALALIGAVMALLMVLLVTFVCLVTDGDQHSLAYRAHAGQGGTLKSLGNGKVTRSFDDDCAATREILSLVGDKWSVLVIVNLGEGTMRFSDLKRAIDGISQRMLTLTLRGLERDGLVTRTVYPTIPPRVDYELTRLGRTLLEPVSALAIWAQRHKPEIQRARAQFEQASRTRTGRALER
jgi:DNA-binding HxlR family transcriptional regulator